MTQRIPEWDAEGVLPPRDEAQPTAGVRSPYRVSLAALVERFATSPERVDILRGFLEYRSALHRVGLVSGFQWIDGSFSEDVERVEGRAPRDVDVVSFVDRPSAAMQPPTDADFEALDHDAAKVRFLVDGYIIEVDELSPRQLVAQSAYWYSLWSHRRSRRWKGFVQIELDPAQEGDAAFALDARAGTLGEQA